MAKRLAMIAAIVLSASTGSSQVTPKVDHIQLGGFDLQLGMDQAVVLRTLAAIYDVEPLDNVPSMWRVFKKNRQQIGAVQFNNSRLSVVNRNRTPARQTAHELAVALSKAVQQLSSATSDPCNISANTTQLGNGEPFDTVRIQCGNRTLTVDADSATASIDEVLWGDKPRPSGKNKGF